MFVSFSIIVLVYFDSLLPLSPTSRQREERDQEVVHHQQVNPQNHHQPQVELHYRPQPFVFLPQT